MAFSKRQKTQFLKEARGAFQLSFLFFFLFYICMALVMMVSIDFVPCFLFVKMKPFILMHDCCLCDLSALFLPFGVFANKHP